MHAFSLFGVLLIVAGCSDRASTEPPDNAQPLVALQPVGTITNDTIGIETDGSLPAAPSLMPTIELSPYWEFPQQEDSPTQQADNQQGDDQQGDSPGLSRLPNVIELEPGDPVLVWMLPPQRIDSLDPATIGKDDDRVVPLPPVDEPLLAAEELAEGFVGTTAAPDVVPYAQTQLDFLVLLPPVELPIREPSGDLPTMATESSEPSLESPHERLPTNEFEAEAEQKLAEVEPTTDNNDVAMQDISSGGTSSLEQVTPADDAKLATGVRTGAKVNAVAKEKIRLGYMLAERGAYFSARQEFIQVLRMISRAKDAKHGAPRRTVALAQGLRALDEAEDFVAHGTQLEADLDVAIIASSHRTPVGKELLSDKLRSQELLPQQLMERYFRYAQVKLASAVVGEPAGSMALHALGKLNSRQGELETQSHALAHRRAFVFQQAALLAHDQNHLAAHELGVLLADSGHYTEAEKLLLQVVRKEPHAVVYHNLARVQKELGHFKQAAASELQANRLAQHSGTQDSRVQWVSPAQFVQASDTATQGLPIGLPVRSPVATSGMTQPQRVVQRPQPRPVEPQLWH